MKVYSSPGSRSSLLLLAESPVPLSLHEERSDASSPKLFILSAYSAGGCPPTADANADADDDDDIFLLVW